MLNQAISSNIGEARIDTELSAVKRVIDFLDEHLPNFPAVFKSKTKAKNITSENKISQELSFFLNSKHQNNIFLFHFQYLYQDSTRSSDFGFIDVATYNSATESSNAFFVIEAKRLPTPGTGREKEYVESDAGGLQRYKKGLHGKDLADSAMIGYIQKHDSPHWLQEINSWIQDLITTNAEPDIAWDKNDLLTQVADLKTTHKYLSKNARLVNSAKDSINIHHYLMSLV